MRPGKPRSARTMIFLGIVVALMTWPTSPASAQYTVAACNDWARRIDQWQAAWTARCVNKTVDPGAAMQACFEDQRQLLAERTRYRQSVCPNIQFYH